MDPVLLGIILTIGGVIPGFIGGWFTNKHFAKMSVIENVKENERTSNKIKEHLKNIMNEKFDHIEKLITANAKTNNPSAEKVVEEIKRTEEITIQDLDKVIEPTLQKSTVEQKNQIRKEVSTELVKAALEGFSTGVASCTGALGVLTLKPA